MASHAHAGLEQASPWTSAGTLFLGLTGAHVKPRLQACAGDRRKDVRFWGVRGTGAAGQVTLRKEFQRCAQVFPVPNLGLDLQQTEPCPLGRERENGSILAVRGLHIPPQSHRTGGHPTSTQCLPQLRECLSGSLGLFPFITQPRATVRSQFPARSCCIF